MTGHNRVIALAGWGLILLTLSIGGASLHAATLTTSSSSLRTDLSLNGEWMLNVGTYSHALAVPANIPFTFGLSTWTKTFSLSMAAPPAVAYLKFDGIVNSGSVELNGATLGPIYGFSETRFDVSGVLNPSGSNTLVVTLDDRLTDSTVPGGPTSGFLQAFGPIAYTFPVAWANQPGIIRSVSLIYSGFPVLSDVYTQQTFNDQMNQLQFTVTAGTMGTLDSNVTFTASLSLSGKQEGSCQALLNSTGSLQCTIQLNNPTLWSPTTPVLHELTATLELGGTVLDAGTDSVGLRKFEARGSRFYLNNQPIFLRGISRHDLYNTTGFVADPQTVQEDLVRIKSLGVNFIRTVHYPPDESVVRYADQYGLLVSEEIPAWANFDSVDVVDTAASMLRSILRRDYNRASVVIYELCSINTQLPTDYLSALVPVAKQYDPSRLYSFVWDDGTSTASGVQSNAAYTAAQGLDFYSQNTYWFAGIFQAVAPALPSTMPFLSTEWTGAEGSDREPLGSSDVKAFPDQTSQTNGVYTEVYEATQMQDAFNAFLPYVCTDSRPAQCVAGTVYFDWQDEEWPAMGYFYANHYDYIRTGLVYEDRVGKAWPLAIFALFMGSLPQ